MEYKHQTIHPLHKRLEIILESQGILKDNDTVNVDSRDYRAKYIVIATVQRRHVLDIEGQELTHNSTDFLDFMDFPKCIAFLGGGFVSIELASIAVKKGSQVSNCSTL